MIRTKELLSAGIVRDIRFCNTLEATKYLDWIRGPYKILDTHNCEDGSIIYRIVSQYRRDTPLIELYDE